MPTLWFACLLVQQWIADVMVGGLIQNNGCSIKLITRAGAPRVVSNELECRRPGFHAANQIRPPTRPTLQGWGDGSAYRAAPIARVLTSYRNSKLAVLVTSPASSVITGIS